MIRVFSSRGYGMTDEQYLMFAFGKDIVSKGAQLFTFKKSLTNSLKMMTKMYNEQVQAAYNNQAPPPPPPSNSPPPSQPGPTPPDVNTTEEVLQAIQKNEEMEQVENDLDSFQQEQEVFGGMPNQQQEVFGGEINQPQDEGEVIMGGSPMSPEEANMISSVTMHEQMEDEISPVKKRRGRPRKKLKTIAPTEVDEKDKPTIININQSEDETDLDLNQGFDMDDAKETEEK